MFTIYGKHVGEPRWPTMVILRVGLAKKDFKKCHPKRIFNPSRGKKRLSFRGELLHTNNDERKSVPKSESVAGSASISDNYSKKKKRKFFPQWLRT